MQEVSMTDTSQDTPTISTGNGKGKIRLITRRSLDGRTKARKQFDAIANGIAADLGGEDRLTTIQKHLVEAFAGCALAVNAINAQLLLGRSIDILEQSSAVSTLVRVASRLGCDRIARDVSPSLHEIMRQREQT
jgi:hypothetical protein